MVKSGFERIKLIGFKPSSKLVDWCYRIKKTVSNNKQIQMDFPYDIQQTRTGLVGGLGVVQWLLS